MSKIINSITLKNYRGFKEECELSLTDANNITFLVGPNNSGKSLITRVFSIFKHTFTQQQNNCFLVKDFNDNDYFLLNIEEPVQIKLGINKEVFQEKREWNL
ncbi:ATP-binding protein [Bacillus sp. OR9]|nr:ATP-binding protein [Bacillus sp. OR9]